MISGLIMTIGCVLIGLGAGAAGDKTGVVVAVVGAHICWMLGLILQAIKEPK